VDPARRAALGLIGLGGAALLAGCEPMGTMAAAPPQLPARQPQGPQTIGNGPITVALIAPLSASGGGGAVGTAIRNAADLAMAELVHGEFQLIVRDDQGTPAGASAAANQVIAEGARLILGPLFSSSVSAAGSVARNAGIPMVAFSSDASVAAPGVYLLSFMPQTDVERIVGYAGGIGKTSFAALIPETAYGSVVQAAFQESTSRAGLRVVGMERYAVDRLKMQEPIARIAPLVTGGQADALLIPEGGDALPLVVQSLMSQGVDPHRVQLLGTGVWEDKRVFADPNLSGGLYAAPDAQGFAGFASRYRARFSTDPVRLASLGYDGVSLAAGLIKSYGSTAFDTANLTSPAGFSGIDGAFRFRADGTSERSLAVLRVTPQGGQTVSPASRSFTA
jgi:ABC-type branched-subunit amino acid transport system substrate-binding protein